VIRDWDVRPDLDMVLRAQGADPEGVRRRRPAAVAIAERVVAEGMLLLEPVVVSATFPVREFRHARVWLEPEGHLAGPLVAQHLHAARSVVVAVRSIGAAVEEAASAYFADDPALSVALDAFRSAAVDLVATAMCARVDGQADAEGLQDHRAAEPGPGGLAGRERPAPDLHSDGRTLRGYHRDRRVHDAAEEVDLTRDRPRTDVDHAGESCNYCSMAETCRYRREHISHLG
jgi:hypothetical protein